MDQEETRDPEERKPPATQDATESVRPPETALPNPLTNSPTGEVIETERLGVLLRSYQGAAA